MASTRLAGRVTSIADSLAALLAIRHARRRLARWACWAWWVARGTGCYREVAMSRCLGPRWRLMVMSPGGEPEEWCRTVSGRVVPIVTYFAGTERRKDFIRTHPGDAAWLEPVSRAERRRLKTEHKESNA